MSNFSPMQWDKKALDIFLIVFQLRVINVYNALFLHLLRFTPNSAQGKFVMNVYFSYRRSRARVRLYSLYEEKDFPGQGM